jgi:DNA-binding CsgD family transcriptional regulator
MEYVMTPEQHEELLQLLKALADEQRLSIIGLMANSERTVGELAPLLNLSEPTVSHHIGRLHSVGLLKLRMAGNQRFYSLNAQQLALFKSYAANIDQPVIYPEAEIRDESWIDALDWPDQEKRILRDHTLNGRLVRLPAKEKAWLAVMHWLAGKFEQGKRYDEKAVNTILLAAHKDYAILRRNLIGYGYMRRERGGSAYWLTPENELSVWERPDLN